MLDILKGLASLVTGGASNAGGAVANVAAYAALIAALSPGVLWLLGHRDEVAVSFTFGQLAISGAVVGLGAFLIVKLAYHAEPPR